MIAFPEMLIGAAKSAGISCPPTDSSGEFEYYEPRDYPHFTVFCIVQLGRSMSHWQAHFENAKIVSAIQDPLSLTYGEIEDMSWH